MSQAYTFTVIADADLAEIKAQLHEIRGLLSRRGAAGAHDPDGCVSVAEAAKLLSISRGRLYVMMGNGELPSVKLGRRRLIPRRALGELLSPKEAGS